MPSREFITFAELALFNFSDGRKEVLLGDNTSVTRTTEDEGAEVIKTIRGSRRAAGHKNGIITYSLSVECKRGSPAEINWNELQRSGVEFDIRREFPESGEVEVMERAKVVGVEDTNDTDGAFDQTVTINYINQDEEPPAGA